VRDFFHWFRWYELACLQRRRLLPRVRRRITGVGNVLAQAGPGSAATASKSKPALRFLAESAAVR